jgi:hypothetical protein
MRRLLMCLLTFLGFAIALPSSMAPADANASASRFVAVAACSYYDLGPVWWVAITGDEHWWTSAYGTSVMRTGLVSRLPSGLRK